MEYKIGKISEGKKWFKEVKMDTYRLFSIILLIIITGIDFYFIETSQEKRRIWTKPFIILLIILLYTQFTKQVSPSLVIALIFSFLVTPFWLFSEKKIYFQLGLFSFLISHILYIYTFAGGLSSGALPSILYKKSIVYYTLFNLYLDLL